MTKNSDLGLKGPRGKVLLSLMTGTGLAALDSTIIATALPAIVGDLKDYAQFPWLFSIFLLAQAVTVPIYAKLSDLMGRKPLLVFGILVFVSASMLSGIAWTMPILILGRALQGIGAGAILPISNTIVGDLYTVEERAKVQGYLASVWAIASVVGPLLGGLFSEYTNWRWIFWINLPLGGVSLLLLGKNFHESVAHRRHRIDFPGIISLSLGLVALILALLEGGQAWAWNAPASLALFTGGAILIAIFILIEKRTEEPILPLWVYSRRLLLTTSLITLGAGIILIGLTSYIPNDLVQALGLSPLIAGASVAAITLGWPLAASLSGRFYIRFGFRRTSILGGSIVLLSVLGLVLVSGNPNFWIFTFFCFCSGLGFGFCVTPSMVAAQASVDWKERGVVTGGNQFARTIGSAVGIAILGALANARLAALPGAEKLPANIVDSTRLVLGATFVVAMIVGLAAWLMPKDSPASPIPESGIQRH